MTRLVRLSAWSQRHPLLDGAVLGPLLGLALLVFRWNGWVETSYGWVLVATVVGTGVGILLGARRARRLQRAGRS
jgi:hypothetical protein